MEGYLTLCTCSEAVPCSILHGRIAGGRRGGLWVGSCRLWLVIYGFLLNCLWQWWDPMFLQQLCWRFVVDRLSECLAGLSSGGFYWRGFVIDGFSSRA